MLSIEEALKLVLERAQPLGSQRTTAVDALGLVLAEAITSDIDSPPHDKSIVDGYAIRSADAAAAGAELAILEEITAGQSPSKEVVPGATSRIMTGAPIPHGADAVVMVEKTELLAADRVRIQQSSVKQGQNIMPRAASLSCGQTVLQPGATLRPIELGLLHEVGRSEVLAHPRPRVGVLATGNELIPAHERPGPSQIRNSNGPMLTGLVRQAGGVAVDLGIGRDDTEKLQTLCQQGLACDVLVISGGVSAGVLDLIPSVLQSLGVEQVFHKINLKPGKPLWFGAKDATLVFGLPGNPVSSLVCFELFVRPAIACMLGRKDGGLMPALARLGCEYYHRGDRVTMYPASLNHDGHGLTATPLPWRGSGDLRTLSDAQAFIHFSGEERRYAAGDEVIVRHL